MVVGAWGGNNGRGTAYVFVLSGSSWVQAAELTASDGVLGDEFGRSVSISGNTAVVGAPCARVAGNALEGAAYIFTEPGSAWTNMARPANLTEAIGAAQDFFGTSVSISGSTVVVGAPDANDWQGTAYVFTGSGSSWAQTAQLTAADAYPSAVFGSSVAISGNTVVVGAPGASTQQGGGGAAYVFTASGSSWAQAAELSTYSGEDSDGFGCSVSISGSTVVVGATLGTAGGNSQQGTAYVFTEPAAGWADMWQTANLIAPDGAKGDGFGNSISVSGTTAVVGASLATVGGNTAQGAAYIFAGWPQPVLSLTMSDSGNFRQGDTADTYTITVNNAGPGGTVGTVTVSDTLSTGLTLTAADSGTVNGWTLSTNGQEVLATRDDPLLAGSSYPPLIVTVGVASNAPSTVASGAAVSFWGEASPGYATASDLTTVNTVAAASKLVFTTAAQTFTAGVTSGTISVQLDDASGNPVLAGSGGQTVNLTSTSAVGLFRNTADTATITTVMIPARTSTVSFKYKDTLAGTPTVTASATGLTSATQQETVSALHALRPLVSVTDAGGAYRGTPFPAVAKVAGLVNGVYATPSLTLEGVTPTLTYYVGKSPSGNGSSSAPTKAGTYTVVAAFPGSAHYATAQSKPLTFIIGKATTATTVLSSASVSGLGQSVTFTATVSVVKPGSGCAERYGGLQERQHYSRHQTAQWGPSRLPHYFAAQGHLHDYGILRWRQQLHRKQRQAQRDDNCDPCLCDHTQGVRQYVHTW